MRKGRMSIISAERVILCAVMSLSVDYFL
uniref:Uncharacterized protein n=1 Tax=Anguilla anguilla TaxID=7936 RepID=A0A0E9R041_ANGAN